MALFASAFAPCGKILCLSDPGFRQFVGELPITSRADPDEQRDRSAKPGCGASTQPDAEGVY